jgi:uncharacterized protein YjlB
MFLSGLGRLPVGATDARCVRQTVEVARCEIWSGGVFGFGIRSSSGHRVHDIVIQDSVLLNGSGVGVMATAQDGVRQSCHINLFQLVHIIYSFYYGQIDKAIGLARGDCKLLFGRGHEQEVICDAFGLFHILFICAGQR